MKNKKIIIKIWVDELLGKIRTNLGSTPKIDIPPPDIPAEQFIILTALEARDISSAKEPDILAREEAAIVSDRLVVMKYIHARAHAGYRETFLPEYLTPPIGSLKRLERILNPIINMGYGFVPPDKLTW